MRPFAVLLSVFLTVLIFGVGYLWAFNPPTQAPPGGSGAIAVDSAGKVGIGTTAPLSKLAADISSSAGDQGEVEFRLGQNDGTARDFIIRKNTSSPYGVKIIGGASPTANTGPVSFFTSDQASGERLTITSSGNIGIGITTPGTKLEVAGQVKITGGSPGANKVLTSDASGLASWQTPVGGEGRTDVLLANVAGECVVGGLKVSRSLPPVEWEGSRAACPAGWWVCSAAERGIGTCNNVAGVGPTGVTIEYCRPTYGTDDATNSAGRFKSTSNPWAWVADAYVVSSLIRGRKVVSTSGAVSDQFDVTEPQRCIVYPVWCCANQ